MYDFTRGDNVTEELFRRNIQKGSNCLAGFFSEKMQVMSTRLLQVGFLLNENISGIYFNALFNSSDLLHNTVMSL